MPREHVHWHSPALGRDMEMLVFGHAGARMLVFPTSMGRFFEWEDQGMIGALGHHIDQGWLQLYCVDSVDAESWYHTGRHPHDRAQVHARYDAYLRDEVLPLTRHRNPNPFCIAAGASFGAYHAVTFGLRYPDLVGRAIGLSGLYDIREQTGGFTDATVSRYNPAQFVAGEHEPGRRAALAKLDLILAIGRDDPMRRANEAFSHELWAAGVWHALRIWDGWAHDWPWWREMITRYVGGPD